MSITKYFKNSNAGSNSKALVSTLTSYSGKRKRQLSKLHDIAIDKCGYNKEGHASNNHKKILGTQKPQFHL